MFGAPERHKIIIVCDKNTRVYANKLSQLIELKDDNGDNIVGIKDGSVEAVIWDEKHFLDNQPNLSSSNNIVFIGDIKVAKDYLPNIENRYEKYGMKYGWLGNIAVLQLGKKELNRQEYQNFIEYCNNEKKTYKEIKRNSINALDNRLKALGLFMPYVWPAAVYGLFAGMKIKKKMKEQQFDFLTFQFYLDGLNRFLEE